MFHQITNFLIKKSEIQNIIEDFIDDDCGDNDIKPKQSSLFEYIIQSRILEDSLQIEEFLILLSSICNNHLRSSKNNLILKIQNILLNFKDKIICHLNGIRIFKIFRENSRILLFLMNNSFFNINNDIIICDLFGFERNIAYFYPELRKLNEKKLLKAVDAYHLQNFIEQSESNMNDFLQNRNIGENESEVAKMIRNDSINNLITYSEQTNLDLIRFTISKSIFETNLFLKKTYFPTIINYAAFYGSIQIIKYLLTKGINMSSDMWLYAIHGRNYEIIHLLEEKNVHHNQFKCFEMAIKCHHNEIAEYLLNNLESNKNKVIESFLICIKERNYNIALELINRYPNFLNDKMEYRDLSQLFFSFIQNKYIDIVKLFIENYKNLINAQNSIFEFKY